MPGADRGNVKARRSSKPKKRGAKSKRTFVRALTSAPRLQTSTRLAPKIFEDEVGLSEKKKRIEVDPSSEDSDKENLDPQFLGPVRQSAQRVQLGPSQKHSLVSTLKKSRTFPGTSTPNLMTEPATKFARRDVKTGAADESEDMKVDKFVEGDDEVSASVRQDKQPNSDPGSDDLNCVQGLLSLSQGNWK